MWERGNDLAKLRLKPKSSEWRVAGGEYVGGGYVGGEWRVASGGDVGGGGRGCGEARNTLFATRHSPPPTRHPSPALPLQLVPLMRCYATKLVKDSFFSRKTVSQLQAKFKQFRSCEKDADDV